MNTYLITDTITGITYPYEPHGDRTALRAAFDDDSVRDTLESVLDDLDADSRTRVGNVSTPVYLNPDELKFLGLKIEDPEADEQRMRESDATHLLSEATQTYRAAEKALDAARTSLHDTVRAGVVAGLTNYRVAKITGLSQTMIGNIVK